MPALTKQSIINLLIDSPLREPIKINLIDILNNTKDADLPKVFPTINKELEIFQKATTRRLKLADDTIKKLSSEAQTPSEAPQNEVGQPTTPPLTDTPTNRHADTPKSTTLQVPPLKLPPLPQPAALTEPTKPAKPAVPTPTINPAPNPLSPLPTPEPAKPQLKTDQPLAETPPAPSKAKSEVGTEQADETALKEIQKELDALKTDAALDASPAAPTTTPEPAKD